MCIYVHFVYQESLHLALLDFIFFFLLAETKIFCTFAPGNS